MGVPIAKMKVTDLKNELDARGLGKTGKKDELVARLISYMEENGDEIKEASDVAADSKTDQEEEEAENKKVEETKKEKELQDQEKKKKEEKKSADEKATKQKLADEEKAEKEKSSKE